MAMPPENFPFDPGNTDDERVTREMARILEENDLEEKRIADDVAARTKELQERGRKRKKKK